MLASWILAHETSSYTLAGLGLQAAQKSRYPMAAAGQIFVFTLSNIAHVKHGRISDMIDVRHGAPPARAAWNASRQGAGIHEDTRVERGVIM